MGRAARPRRASPVLPRRARSWCTSATSCTTSAATGWSWRVYAVVAILFRKPGPLLILATAGVTAVVWGIIQAVGAQRTIGTLNEHIDELKAKQRRLESELEDLE